MGDRYAPEETRSCSATTNGTFAPRAKPDPWLPTGRTATCSRGGGIRIREEWERYGQGAATGVSYLEEVEAG
jgi:hypothetical protein